MSRVETGVVGILLVLVGALAWWLALRPPLAVDAERLGALPHQLDEWTGVDVPLEGGVEQMLRADFHVQRLYSDSAGDRLWLYIGYYGTRRGGRPEHTPRACYEAHGWAIRERRVLTVEGAPGLRVNEYLVERDGVWQLVHFWFRSSRSTGLVSGWDQAVDHFLGRLRDDRADGSLVRLAAVLPGPDLEEPRSRLLRFAAELDRQLDAHWPSEVPIGRES